MYEITLSTDAAVIIRDALRIYKERWPGGDPAEQESIEFLQLQFTKMVLESYIDAWRPKHGTGLRYFGELSCLKSNFVNESVNKKLLKKSKF